MKKDIFNDMANIVRPMKEDEFLSQLMPLGYALETLINGNVSECIRYLNMLISHDIKYSNQHFETRNFILQAFDELNLIKDSELVRLEQYKYIKDQLTILKNKRYEPDRKNCICK